MPRRLRVRMTGRANEWVSLYGSLEGFQKHIDGSVIWLYQEPVRLRVGERWLAAGTQPALQNGQFRILLTDPDSDEPAWDYDVEKIIGGGKRLRAFDGEEVEVELLPSGIVRKIEEVKEEVAASAPVVQPIAAPLREAARPKCPFCGYSLEGVGLYCFGCGKRLPGELAVSLVFGVALVNTWEELPDHQRGRVSAAFRRVEKGRKFSRQVRLADRYLMVLLAIKDDASNVTDQNVLAEVLDELGAGKVLTDTYEIKMIMKMLKERHGEEIWRDA